MTVLNCLDCALFECDQCASFIGEEYGCCCGRVRPADDEDDYYDDEWPDE